MNPRIYLDNNAGTLVDPRIIPVLVNHLNTMGGNPSSFHFEGREARALLNKARATIAAYFNIKKSNEFIFTSSGTEALNMILRGVFADQPKGHLITSTVEHSAVYKTVKELESKGCKVTYLEPGFYGSVKPEDIQSAIRPDTRLIATLAVNNETGVKTDIDAIAGVAQKAKVPFLVDAVSWLGKETISIPEGVAAMCFSGYKCHAPKGIGFAYVRSSLKLTPLVTGGDQEFGRRAGTENLLGILGLAEAIQLLKIELPQATMRMASLRDKLEQGLMKNLAGVYLNGEGPRICNTTNLSFEGVEGETLLARLDMAGISASHGSACASGALEPSRILLNMGISREIADSSVRFSLSRLTKESEIDRAIDIITQLVSSLRTHLTH